MKYKKKER